METETAISKTLFGIFDVDTIFSKGGFNEADVRVVVIDPVPDYVRIENGFAWVLDAKSPGEKIINDDNIEQVYCYAAYPEIRNNYLALCNGTEFACYRTTETNTPVLYFRIQEIDEHWQELKKTLSAESFQAGKAFVYENKITANKLRIYGTRKKEWG
jgi:hypothetical protein